MIPHRSEVYGKKEKKKRRRRKEDDGDKEEKRGRMPRLRFY